MATHSIGQGKTLVCVPVDIPVALELGKRSYQETRYTSKAAIVRALIEGYLSGKIHLPAIALLLGLSASLYLNSRPEPVDCELVRAVRVVRRPNRGRGRREWDSDEDFLPEDMLHHFNA